MAPFASSRHAAITARGCQLSGPTPPLPPSSDLVVGRGRLLPPAAAPGLAGLRHGELQPVL